MNMDIGSVSHCQLSSNFHDYITLHNVSMLPTCIVTFYHFKRPLIQLATMDVVSFQLAKV